MLFVYEDTTPTINYSMSRSGVGRKKRREQEKKETVAYHVKQSGSGSRRLKKEAKK